MIQLLAKLVHMCTTTSEEQGMGGSFLRPEVVVLGPTLWIDIYSFLGQILKTSAVLEEADVRLPDLSL